MRPHTLRLFAILALLAVVGLAACSEATPTSTPPVTPVPVTPAAEGDIRDQIVQAIQRPGFVTKVGISISALGAEGFLGSQTSWIDLPGQRARVESCLASGLLATVSIATVSIMSSGTQTTYSRTLNTVHESSDWFMLPPELAKTLPPSLNNPALMGLGHLVAVLLSGDWHPAGKEEWKGASASIWKIDTSATIYLNAETLVPIAMELDGFKEDGRTSDVSFLVTYEFEFLAPEAVPEGIFDVRELYELQQNYGGKLDEARGLDFTVVWLGKEFDLGEDYPKLELTNINLGLDRVHLAGEPVGDLVGAFVGFSYRVPDSAFDESQGRVNVRVWERHARESQLEKNALPEVWLRDPALLREPVTVSGVQAEFAIGSFEPPAPTV